MECHKLLGVNMDNVTENHLYFLNLKPNLKVIYNRLVKHKFTLKMYYNKIHRSWRFGLDKEMNSRDHVCASPFQVYCEPYSVILFYGSRLIVRIYSKINDGECLLPTSALSETLLIRFGYFL